MKKLLPALFLSTFLSFGAFAQSGNPLNNPVDLNSIAQDTCSDNANGPCLQNEAASATNPTLVPDKTDLDTGVGGDGSDAVSLITGGTEGLTVDSSQNSIFKPVSGATLNIRSATTELTGMSGATVTATNLIPAGSFIYGTVIRVTALIEGATAFHIGDGSDADRWGASIALSAGTTTTVTDFTAAGFGQFSSANDVVLTATVSNFTAGAVRIVVHYIDLTAPTS